MEIYFNFIDDLSIFFSKVFVFILIILIFILVILLIWNNFLVWLIDKLFSIDIIINNRKQYFEKQLDLEIKNLLDYRGETFVKKFEEFINKYKINRADVLSFFSEKEKKILEDWIYKDKWDNIIVSILKSSLADLKNYILKNKRMNFYADIRE